MKEEKAEGTRQQADKTQSFRFDCLLPTVFCFLFFHSAFRNSLVRLRCPIVGCACDLRDDALAHFFRSFGIGDEDSDG